jgi:hypothetical protein
MSDQTDQSGRGGQWLTYRDLAERLGISVEAAQQKARRGRWQRRDNNDGRRLVLVPYETLDTPTIPGTKPPHDNGYDSLYDTGHDTPRTSHPRSLCRTRHHRSRRSADR